ncbi:MAG: hypothetical protein N2423_00845 [Novosphingobium sp.]|nr:hypothetical protein [Novosphingobium sp.]
MMLPRMLSIVVRFRIRAHAGEPPGPFDWRYAEQALLVRAIRRTQQGWAMDYDSDEPALVQLASRVLRLAPGSHRLTIASTSGEGDLLTTVSCLDATGKARRLAIQRNEGALVFDVPATNCLAQQLSLMAERGARQGLRVAVD